MPRDRIAELSLIRHRQGKYRRMPSKYDLEELKRVWNNQLKGVDPVDELVPIRIVTLLEVFLRYWIEALIDHGAPYVERASNLKLDLKYDFAIARSLQGGSVTLGQLIAHSVSLSRVDALSSVLQTLLDQDIFAAISETRDRWKVKHEGDSVGPIISDITWLRRTLVRLFEVRHILVHELPENKPHELNDVAEFLDAAALFVDAVGEEFATRLYGDYPMTQSEMNRDAAARHEVAMTELEELCREIAIETASDEIYKVQQAWLTFKEAEAERQTQRHLGGSIRPMLYSLGAIAESW
jgi:Lysozyme inhibitor LprI